MNQMKWPLFFYSAHLTTFVRNFFSARKLYSNWRMCWNEMVSRSTEIMYSKFVCIFFSRSSTYVRQSVSTTPAIISSVSEDTLIFVIATLTAMLYICLMMPTQWVLFALGISLANNINWLHFLDAIFFCLWI